MTALSDDERAAIAAFHARGRTVTVCPPGVAAGLSAQEVRTGQTCRPPSPADDRGWSFGDAKKRAKARRAAIERG